MQQRHLVCVYRYQGLLVKAERYNNHAHVPTWGQCILLNEPRFDQRDYFNAPGTVYESVLQNTTLPLLDLLDLDAFCGRMSFVAFLLGPNSGVNSLIEDFLNASRFLGAAFDV